MTDLASRAAPAHADEPDVSAAADGHDAGWIRPTPPAGPPHEPPSHRQYRLLQVPSA